MKPSAGAFPSSPPASASARVPVATGQVVNRCTSDRPMGDPLRGASWNGHGNGLTATRFQAAKAGKLTAADLPRLKLKWAFGYAGVGAARAQPTLAGGRLFVASENGEVHALDPKTGCTYWTFKAQAGVRTAPVAAAWRDASGKHAARRSISATDARTSTRSMRRRGTQLWTRKIDDHAVGGDHRQRRSSTTAASSSACRASARKVAAPPTTTPAARSAAA